MQRDEELQDGPTGSSHETIKLILSRSSTRDQFSDQPVSDDVIRVIIRCGLSAPSSKNAKPWRLHVVTDRALLQELALAVEQAEGADNYAPVDPLTGLAHPEWKSTVAESATTLRAVPLAIFIENLGVFSRGIGTLAAVAPDRLRACLVTYTLEVLGVGSALMNLWLAANALGLKAAFMGDVCVAEAAIAKKLGLQRDLIGVLAIGYSSSDSPKDRRDGTVAEDVRVVWHPKSSDKR